jgi:hypothetical protein
MSIDISPATVGVAPTVALPEIAADLIRSLYLYLRANAERHTELALAIPVVRAALAQYRSGSLVAAIDSCRTAFALIQQTRLSAPDLPEP